MAGHLKFNIYRRQKNSRLPSTIDTRTDGTIQ